MRIAWLACTALLALAARAEPATGLREEVTFTEYGEPASSAEVLHRLLSPLAAAQVDRTLAASHQALQPFSVDLAAERYALYVPAKAPPQGYALLVFIPPWDAARVPPGWGPVLERTGTVFVTAARSGNDADDLTRRAPLALLAAVNVTREYPIDPARIYVAGFSGGARVALRIALAYPDLFRGALLNAGSDAIDAGPPSPAARERLAQFRASSRLVYVTGADDRVHLDMDADSQESLRRWCMDDYAAEVTPKTGHEVAGGAALARALGDLGRRRPADSGRNAGCDARLQGQVAERLGRIASLIAAGKPDKAQSELSDLDRHYGGLAAPRSLELEEALGWRIKSR
ncbi:MAG TPA: PHB depolymerase family esterase [Steroidobacteraceae bacterium]|nr:PHB depolymerase family esterase [Steroidobacteraceae bacterium]